MTRLRTIKVLWGLGRWLWGDLRSRNYELMARASVHSISGGLITGRNMYVHLDKTVGPQT